GAGSSGWRTRAARTRHHSYGKCLGVSKPRGCRSSIPWPAPHPAATAHRAPRRRTVNVPLSLTVNGKAVEASVDPRTLLVQFIREHLRLTGTHVGCDTAQCGACTVHLDGRAVKACSM